MIEVTLAEQFEELKAEAQKLDLISTDVLYRRIDGQPSMKKRLKHVNGESVEVLEDKPIKSVHLIEVDGFTFRIKKSNYERKQHLEFFLTLARQQRFQDIHALLMKLSGTRKGKNIHWSSNGVAPHDFDSIAHYFQILAQEAEDEKVAKDNPDIFQDRPLVGDDLILMEGW